MARSGRQTAIIASLILLVLAASAGGARAAFLPYTFGVIGDTQPLLDAKDRIAPNTIYMAATAQMQTSRLSFVVHLGDHVWGDPAVFQSAMEWARYPEQLLPHVYEVAGNHDILSSAPEIYGLYRQLVGPTYYSWVYQNDLFIVLSSEEPGEQCQVTGVQLQWLARTLATRRRQARNVFVFIHEPLWGGGQPWCLLPSNWAADVHPLLAHYRATAVFGGHNHGYFDWGVRDGVHYLVSGGGGGDLHDWRVQDFLDWHLGTEAECVHHWLSVTVSARGAVEIALVPVPATP